MDPELRQALEQIEQRISQSVHGEIRASEARMRGHVDQVAEGARQHVDQVAEETRRHTAILVEGLRSDFRVATEGFTPLNRRMDAVEGQGEQTTQRVDLLESRVSVLEHVTKPRRPRPRSA